MKMLWFTLLATAVLCGLAVAAAPTLINFQGRLTTPSGTPVPDSTYSVNFTLYDAPSGGVPQWGETQSVTTTAGLFSVQLGSVILFGSDVFSDSVLWLSITVGADPELAPRTRLISVPYARHATIGGGWRDDGGSVHLNNNTSNVGIGTVTPSHPLHVVDASGGIFPMRVEGLSTLATVTELHNSTSSATWEHGVAGSDGIFFGGIAPGSSYLYKQGTGFPSIVMTPERRVGIGTGLPSAQLDVQNPSDTIVGYFRGSADGGDVLFAEHTGPTVTGTATAIHGRSVVGHLGVGGAFEGKAMGVYAQVEADNNLGEAVYAQAFGDLAGSKYAVKGVASGINGDKYGVYGIASGNNGDKYGMIGTAMGDNGIRYGVYGNAFGDGGSNGGYFTATGSGCKGIYAGADGSGATGVYVEVFNVSSYAGYFKGSVHVAGTLSKSAGSFKIDHPLYPESKYLQHSFVESPDMKNIYDGNVTTDGNGNATITLPDWFEALNRDFRYQLTVVGQFAQAIVSSKVANNQFSIRSDKPNVEVSWQVTGIRKDAYAEAYRIQVEVDKRGDERGKYQFPELFGKTEEYGIGYEMRKKMRDDENRLAESQKSLNQKDPE